MLLQRARQIRADDESAYYADAAARYSALVFLLSVQCFQLLPSNAPAFTTQAVAGRGLHLLPWKMKQMMPSSRRGCVRTSLCPSVSRAACILSSSAQNQPAQQIDIAAAGPCHLHVLRWAHVSSAAFLHAGDVEREPVILESVHAQRARDINGDTSAAISARHAVAGNGSQHAELRGESASLTYLNACKAC